MHWNHRVFKTVRKNGEVEFSIREVHYNEKNEIYGHMINPVTLSGESIEDLKEYVQWCLNCFEKPVLEEGKIIFADDGEDDDPYNDKG